MKVTKSYLKKIIKEELSRVLNENEEQMKNALFKALQETEELNYIADYTTPEPNETYSEYEMRVKEQVPTDVEFANLLHLARTFAKQSLQNFADADKLGAVTGKY
jgi:hypothetical protein